MPTLVHIADERDVAGIVRNGLKIARHGKRIFFMPVTQDFYTSHQWLRELKRRGIRTFVGIYFRLKSDELIWFGKYHEGHTQMQLGKALAVFMKADDKLGFEFLIERKINPKELVKIKNLPQTVGWRYMPDSHRRKLTCACPICITPGDINSTKKREKIEPRENVPSLKELIEKLKVETDEIKIDELFSLVRRKRRRADPEEFRFIIDSGNVTAITSLALSLQCFSHPNTIRILTELCSSKYDEVREFSATSILEIYKSKGVALLNKYLRDSIISNVVNDYLKIDDEAG